MRVIQLSLLALAGLCLSACQSSPRERIWPVVHPDPNLLHADVAWLADDAREGRRAGTRGEAAAAEWLAERMAALGLEPAGEGGTYFQSFEVPLPARDGGTSRVSRAGDGELGRAVPLFCSEGGAALGPLLFAGYGIVHEAEGWDDYTALDVKGKVVLMVRGTPRLAAVEEAQAEGDDTALVSAGDPWTGRGSIFHKVMEAKRRGAVAVLLVPHPDDADAELLRFDAGGTARAGIPALMVDVAAATKLLPGFAAGVRALDQRQEIAIARRGPETGVFADVQRGFGTARNVLGRLPARAGTAGRRAVVLGAHFDHLGHGGEGSLARDATDQIHNGADDNASGTAVVLELARLLRTGEPPAGDVIFALWSGEELGLLGSDHWLENPTVPVERLDANLNFDMVGRAGDGVVQVLGAGSAAPFYDWLQTAGPAAGLNLEVSRSGQGMGGSDHQSFLRRKVPALHFFSGVHTDYHKPTDDVERFEADGAAAVARLAYMLVLGILEAERDELAFVEPPPKESDQGTTQSGFSAWLGSVPAYAYEGVGVKLSGTSDGSPAQRAGLLEGDILMGLGDVDIVSIYDLVFALQHYKPGDVVLARYVRDGSEESVRLTLSTRSLE